MLLEKWRIKKPFFGHSIRFDAISIFNDLTRVAERLLELKKNFSWTKIYLKKRDKNYQIHFSIFPSFVEYKIDLAKRLWETFTG